MPGRSGPQNGPGGLSSLQSLIRVLIPPDDGECLADDHEVESQRPVAHVVDVVLDAGTHLVEGFGFAAPEPSR